MVANGLFTVLQVGKYYPPHVGGMETHLETLCGELGKYLDVKVVVANDRRWREEAAIDGVNVTRVGTPVSFASAPICPGLVHEIRNARADIIHIHLPNPSAVLAYLMSNNPAPLVVTYHSDVIRQKVLGGLFAPLLRRMLDRCAMIIATSRNYIESSPILAGYRDRCRVIPHGIPVGQFHRYDQAVVARIRGEFGPRIVISVGRLVYYKGLDYLIRAMESVKGNLLIVGEGPLRASLEREAEVCGVRDRVFFLGEVQDVVPYYHAADVFALASVARSEAFGIVQLEAMTCGKPVVNTRLASGVPFVSLDRVTGLTVPPANQQALAAAINTLLDDPKQRIAYGQAARRRVREGFSVEVMASRTLELYAEVTGTAIERHRLERYQRVAGG
jgi:glycosyltransferase involved in cell wall biosynthesis